LRIAGIAGLGESLYNEATLTVTINAIHQETAQKLYSWVSIGIPSFLKTQKTSVKKAVLGLQ